MLILSVRADEADKVEALDAGAQDYVVTQDMILRGILGPAHADDAQYLRVSIRQLRQKLGDNAANLRFIAAEPGLGYRFLEALGG